MDSRRCENIKGQTIPNIRNVVSIGIRGLILGVGDGEHRGGKYHFFFLNTHWGQHGLDLIS